VLCLEENLLGAYHKLAESLRVVGLSAEVFPEKKKLAVQFGYAEKKGIPLAIVWGEDEEKAGLVGLKDLRTRQNYDKLTREQAIEKAKELLR
jgi:histidyl-tRNA synthetase